jgi:hypothetical protein
VGPHESITCGVYGIYLKFGSFNGIDPIVPKKQRLPIGETKHCWRRGPDVTFEECAGTTAAGGWPDQSPHPGQGQVSPALSPATKRQVVYGHCHCQPHEFGRAQL